MSGQRTWWSAGAVVALGIAFSGSTARAAVVTFSTPVTIAGDADVVTMGGFKYAYNWANAAQTVNGVSFTGTNSASPSGGNVTLANLGSNNTTAFGSASGNPWNNLSTGYRNILKGGNYGGTAAGTVTLGNLVSGHQYAVQFWVNDNRSGSTATRTETIAGGGNTQTLSYNNTKAAGGVGQYTIGRFTANAATQAFSVTGNASSQINAIQLRDVTGTWSGTTDGNWDEGTPNFSGLSFAGVKALTSNVYFADKDAQGNAVTRNAVTVAAGGVTGANVYFQNSSVNYTLSSSDPTGVAGPYGLTLQGTGRVTLAGANTYTGNTTVSAGTLQVGHAAAVPSGAGAGNVAVSGTLDLAGFSPTINGLSGGGTITSSTVGTGTLTVGANDQTSAFSGVVQNGSGTVALVKTGIGTLTLSGSSSTYSGGTVVEAGTLKLSGANNGYSAVGAGSLTIQTGATVEANSHNTLGNATGAQLTPLVINRGTFLADQYNHINSLTMTAGTVGIRSGVSQVDGMYFRTRDVTAPTVATNASDSTSTISSKVTLYDGTTFTVADGGAAQDLLVSGPIVGAAGLVKAGPGAMVLAAANTYTGATMVNAGTLEICDSLSRSDLTVKNTSTLQVDALGTALQALAVEGGSTLVLPAAATATTTLTGALSFSSTPHFTVRPFFATTPLTGSTFDLLTPASVSGDAGTITTDLGSYGVTRAAGSTAVTDGKLVLTLTTGAANLVWNNGAGTGSWNLSGYANFDNGGSNDVFKSFDAVTFDETAPGSVNLVGSLAPSAVVVNAGGNYTFSGSGSIAGAGSLTKSGGGTLTIETANSYTGGTTISGGTLSVSTLSNGGVPSPVGASASNAANLTLDGARLEYTGATLSIDRGMTLGAGGGTITVTNPAAALALAGGTITGAGPLNKTGDGTLTLSGANVNYTGTTTVSAGTLKLADTSAFASDITNNAAVQLGGTTTWTLSKVIGGTGGVTKNDAGSVTLSGAAPNTYAGTTVLKQGYLYLDKTAATAIPVNTIVQMGAGTADQPHLRMLQSNQFGAGVVMTFPNASGNWGRFDLQGTTQTLAGISSATDTLQGAVIQNERQGGGGTPGPATLILNNDTDYAYWGYLRDEDDGGTNYKLSLVKNGSGTQALIGDKVSYTGVTTVHGGVLALQDTTAFASPVVVTPTGTLNAARTTLGLSGKSPVMGNAVSGYGTININNAGDGASGGWTTVSGATGSLNFHGTINVNSGVFSRDNRNVDAITGTATVNVAAGAVFAAGRGGNSTIGALNGAGYVSTLWSGTNAGSITLGNGDGSGTFSGVISGNGTSATDGTLEGGVLSLIKVGAGIQTLSGANTYSGGTTINAGTLVAGHADALGTAGTITVNAGGTLAIDSGVTFTRAVTFNAGATLAGSGTYTPGATFEPAATVAFSPGISGVGTPGGVGTLTIGNHLTLWGSTLRYDLAAEGNDAIAVSGNLVLIGAGPSTLNTIAVNADPAPGTYTIMTYTGGLLGGASNLATPANTRRTYRIVDPATTPGSVQLTVGGNAPASLVWAGDGSANAWDVNTTANWRNGGSADKFYNADAVTFNDAGSISPAVTINGNIEPGSVTVSSANHYTFAADAGGGAIAGATGLTKSGAGTLTITAPNTYRGNTVLSAGALEIGVDPVGTPAAITSSATGTGRLVLGGGTVSSDSGWASRVVLNPVTFGGDVTLGDAANSGALDFQGGGTLTGPRQVTVNSPVTFNSALGGSGSLTKAGPETLVLSAANSYVGPTTVSAGILQLGNGGATGSVNGAIYVAEGAELQFFRKDGSASAITNTITGPGDLRLRGDGTSGQSGYTVSSDLSGLAGTCYLDQARYNAYGASNVPANIEVLPGGAFFAAFAGTFSSNITIAGQGWNETAGLLGALRFGVAGVIWSGSVTLSADARITTYNTAGGTITGKVSGDYELEVINGGATGTTTVTLAPAAGPNTYGSLRVGTAGTLVAGNADALSPGLVTMAGGTLKLNGYSFSVANLAGTSGSVQNGSATTASSLTVGADGNDSSYGGTLSNGAAAALSLTKVGAGTLVLSGANTYSGGTKINAGVLSIRHGSALGGTAGSATVADGAALEIQGDISASPVPLTLNGSGIAGGGGLRNVSGNNAYTGAITLASPTRINSDVDTLALSGSISNGANLLTVGGAGNTFISGPIGGASGLVKDGEGVLTLGGNNTYAGETKVQGGTLRLVAPAIPAGAAGYYSFENVTDTTVNNDGTLGATANGTLTNGASVVSGGIRGNAMAISGGVTSTQMMQIATPIALNGMYTISAWFNGLNSSNGANWRTLFRGSDLGGTTGDHAVIISNNTSDLLGFYGNKAGGGFISNGYSMSGLVGAADWHQLTAVANGAYTAFYLDGVQVGTNVAKVSTKDIFAVGNYNTGTQAFAQKIDEVYVYDNVALLPDQVLALYRGSLGSPGNLIPDTSKVSIDALAALEVNDSHETIGPLAGGGTISLGTGTLTVNSSDGVQGVDSAFSGNISGAGRVIKQGAGTLTLSGQNTYSGGSTVDAGTLAISAVGALPAGGSVTIGAGGALVLSSGLSVGAGAGSGHAAAAPVPEPGTLALLAAGLAAVLLAAWRRRSGLPGLTK